MGEQKEKSIYRIKREESGLTREKASELLVGLQPERIERIESGKFPARPEEVVIMSDGYRSPELCNHYCVNECAIGRRYVPEIKMSSLAQVTLQILSSLNALSAEQSRLIEIAADGTIDENEIGDFIKMQEELERLSISIEELQIWTERMIAENRIDRDAYERAKGGRAG